MAVVAWAGLVLAWIGLLLLVKLVFMCLRVLKQIRRLAEMTRDAAAHLADNLAGEEAFAELEVLAEQLASAARGLPAGVSAARPRVSSVSPGVPGRFP
jgi:type VI protein secretion system component VasK